MTPLPEGFDADRLLSCLAELPAATRYRVGFSGGADSTALLEAMSELADRCPAAVHAVHFNHGLQPDADDWEAVCARFCAQRSIPFLAVKLNLSPGSGQSPELAARRARYAAVSKLLQPGEIYLTAHQANDRAETLFLNLMRGCGIDGLASIPRLRPLGAGWVARPLLPFSRAELEAYLAGRGIDWVDDPSNRDTSVDRNYLRHEIFPMLEMRWPGIKRRLVQTAEHARETMDALAGELNRHFGHVLLDDMTLHLSQLLRCEPALQALLIRLWVRDRDAPPPPRARLAELLAQLRATAAVPGSAEIRWAGWQIKRHRDRLWLHEHPPPPACPEVPWTTGDSLELQGGFGVLTLTGVKSAPPGLAVGPRHAGSRMALRPGGPSRTLKDLMRESGVPPWLRDAIPVLYRGDEVLALGDWLLSCDWRDWLAKHAADYQWRPEHELLVKLHADCHAATIDRPAAVS